MKFIQIHPMLYYAFSRDSPNFWRLKKGGKGAIVPCVPIFYKNLSAVMYTKFRNVPIFKGFFLPLVHELEIAS